MSRKAPRSCGYAPQIMMLIERVTGREFLKDHHITDLKPQNPTTPTITMDITSSSVAPHTTHTDLAPPPLGHSDN
jgi:hypothetical protein